MGGSTRGYDSRVISFLLVAAGIEASLAVYFNSLGVSDATLLVLVSSGVTAVLSYSWAEVRVWAPVSREARAERRLKRKERRRSRKEVEGWSSISPDLRGAILVLSVFLVVIGVPILLTSTPVFASLQDFYRVLPDQLRGVVDGTREFLQPIYNLGPVYKYALSQNFAALCSSIAVALIGRWRRR